MIEQVWTIGSRYKLPEYKNEEIHKITNTHDYSKDYFTVEALEDTEIQLSYNNIKYSINNGETWEVINKDTPVSVSAGSKVLYKGSLVPVNNGTSGFSGIGVFSSTGKINVSGNIMSLLYEDLFQDKISIENYGSCFFGLFTNCTTLISAENLILPRILSKYCFCSLFENCTNLVESPKIYTDTLEYYCFNEMFYNCSKLTKIYYMGPDIINNNSTGWWVKNISTNGTFIKKRGVSIIKGIDGIPENWSVKEI